MRNIKVTNADRFIIYKTLQYLLSQIEVKGSEGLELTYVINRIVQELE